MGTKLKIHGLFTNTVFYKQHNETFIVWMAADLAKLSHELANVWKQFIMTHAMRNPVFCICENTNRRSAVFQLLCS